MRKTVVALLLLSMFTLSGCAVFPRTDFSQRVVNRVADHSVAIAAYYYMTESEATMRLNALKQIGSGQVVVALPTDQKTPDGEPVMALAYIGAGTIIAHNHVFTVRHLFVHEDGAALLSKIYILRRGTDHAVEADIVALSEGATQEDDYAVLRMRENLGLPGIRFAEKDARPGERVICCGSTGGSAFFMRFVFVTRFQHFFRRDDKTGQLHLSMWHPFPYITIYPSGPGDSGGGVFNTKGKYVGLMYCGVQIHAENYVFSNPIEMAWAFLKKHNLENLARGEEALYEDIPQFPGHSILLSGLRVSARLLVLGQG